MNKRLLIALIAICLGTHLTGCASGGSSEDGEVAEANDETFAEEGEGDFADESAEVADDAGGEATDESTQTADAGEVPPEDEGGDLDLGDEAVAEGETAPTDEAAPVETAEAAPAGGEEELSLDDGALPDEVASTEEGGGDALAAAPPPTDEPLFSSESSAAPEEETQVADSAAPVEPPPARSEVASSSHRSSAPAVYAPYLKMKESAFTAGDGTTLNRVYLARPKDNVKSVSQKLYGSDRSKDLRKWNPILSRGVRTGDKIYYSSPSNPSDNRMLTYYEEANIQPQTYVSKEGDNIRTVSKSLLGFNDAWKEVWATNFNVESKGNIPPGLELRYWSEVAGAPVLANNNPGQLPPVEPQPTGASTLPNDQIAANQPLPNPDPLAPPPPVDDPLAAPPQDPTAQQPNQAANDPLAPPPLPNDPSAQPPADPNAAAAAAGTVGQPPDAPAPPSEPQAQPNEVKPVAKRPPPVVDEGMDENTMMAMGLGAILLFAAAGIFVFVRKNRARKMDLTQTTQV